MLDAEELKRYDRQMLLPGWGQQGQNRLKTAKIVVAGAGGLGSASLIYLAAAGVGSIRIIDGDQVEPGNLNRQVLYGIKDIGKPKAVAAANRLRELNPFIEIEGIPVRITESSADDLVDGRLIVDALDNLPTRCLLNAVAIKQGLTLFHGAVYGFEGRATTFVPGRTGCLNCLYHDVIPGTVPVAGVTPAVIGSIQATEVIKYITGIGDILMNRLLLYDGIAMKFTEMLLKKDPKCGYCGRGMK